MTLSEPWRAALGAIVGAEAAWTARGPLEAAGHGPALLELEAAGWVARWDRDRAGRALDAERVTLTPIAAERLGVEVVEFAEARPSWAEPGREPPWVRLPPERPGWRCGIALPGLIPDPRPPGPEAAIDERSGEPLTLFNGVPVWVDARLRGGRRAG